MNLFSFPKKIFLFLPVLLAFFSIFSSSVLAVPCDENSRLECSSNEGLVPCGYNGVYCTFPHFWVMVDRIIQFALFYIALPVGVIWIIVGGFLMMTSAGNESRFSKGKDYIRSVIIALLIAFGAWLIVDTLVGFLNIQK
ncbi:MAG: hypothetical protein KatS3mg098_108 [Candidatus Parcubacteria bacterium]|nr:MAG: hypothetical protein KatS3mg098_108 [Candidatus Parcubacteria bacterium]